MKYFIVPFIVLCALSSAAQDVLLLRTGEEVQAKVEEVTASEVKYRKYDNLSGPLYTIKKAELFMIRYENGSKDVFNEQPPATNPTPASPLVMRSGESVDEAVRKTKGAALVGYVAVAPILGLGIGAAATSDEAEPSLALGIPATLIAGVTIPVVAGRARKTRTLTGVSGSPGMRIAGWITYGLTMTDALFLIGMGFAELETGAAPIIAVTLLGSASSIFMAVDAQTTATQAGSVNVNVRRVRFEPTLGVTNVPGKSFNTLGVRMRF